MKPIAYRLKPIDPSSSRRLVSHSEELPHDPDAEFHRGHFVHPCMLGKQNTFLPAALGPKKRQPEPAISCPGVQISPLYTEYHQLYMGKNTTSIVRMSKTHPTSSNWAIKYPYHIPFCGWWLAWYFSMLGSQGSRSFHPKQSIWRPCCSKARQLSCWGTGKGSCASNLGSGRLSLKNHGLHWR